MKPVTTNATLTASHQRRFLHSILQKQSLLVAQTYKWLYAKRFFFIWASSWNQLLATLDLRADVEQPLFQDKGWPPQPEDSKKKDVHHRLKNFKGVIKSPND